ncbi:hypothetical protein [Amycolatopsis sp. DSM 110486]|uniref:hypothetical protein n=1 Tax=Amycolatopsis sp. DSM 110486 TaxID=2865832 RepID=UPI001C6A6403|nr:hypothetical protein [Amycolatopsis sp. DSM 110486]QYN19367.1 hypothetical protein K1T34_43235 [Amycolatopsis sp. DSM 110486]
MKVRKLAAGVVGAVVLGGCAAPADSPGQSFAGVLETVLPPGFTVISARPAPPVPPDDSVVSASFTVKSGAAHVEANLGVGIARLPVPVPVLFAACPDTSYHPYSRCSSTVLATGGVLNLDTSPVDAAAPDGEQRWSAQVTFGDQRQVFATETPLAGSSEAAVPLAELETVVSSPRWDPLGPQPAHSAPAKPPATGDPEARAIVETLTTLVPQGLHVADGGGQGGYGHLTVDDSHVRALVVVTLQRWKRDDPTLAPLYRTTTTDLDGTKIATTDLPSPDGGKDVREWKVDVLHPSGVRVVVSTLNAPGYGVPATRTDPALAQALLRRIALSPEWEKTG